MFRKVHYTYLAICAQDIFVVPGVLAAGFAAGTTAGAGAEDGACGFASAGVAADPFTFAVETASALGAGDASAGASEFEGQSPASPHPEEVNGSKSPSVFGQSVDVAASAVTATGAGVE